MHRKRLAEINTKTVNSVWVVGLDVTYFSHVYCPSVAQMAELKLHF